MTDQLADRIKLAEWIGTIGPTHIDRGSWANWIGLHWNPFEDANDDYAVLEAMRLMHRPEVSTTSDQWLVWDRFVVNLPNCLVDDYQIGHYARAALKTINTDGDKP